MKTHFNGIIFVLLACLLPAGVMVRSRALAAPLDAEGSGVVATDAGKVEGVLGADAKVRMFKGIPFAAPPVGELRWKPPQPVANWTGVRKAAEFGARCMQPRVFPGKLFRGPDPSEDCLYLNVFTPSPTAAKPLPVMVWIYGGGFTAGSASEPRQDPENMAKKGVVVVSMEYRLGVFGFFSLPELTRESEHHASGNYGLLDQVAALEWVRRNVAAFGGDPHNVTIFGESAGSFSVSALMASPLAQGLFQKAIGESGALLGALRIRPLAEAEAAGEKFANSLGAPSLAVLRALPADQLYEAASKPGTIRTSAVVDGYFLPEDIRSIFTSGKQSHVPLLAGWNSDEGNFKSFFKGAAPTVANYVEHVHTLFGDHADAFLKLYPAATDDQARRSAQDYEGDRFLAGSTWNWIELQAATGHSRIFRYEFEDAPPSAVGSTEPSLGAYHGAEIGFVFENLAWEKLPWRPEDEKLSHLMCTYWTNFAKTGNPNGPGLPHWPAYSRDHKYQVMHLNANSHAAPDVYRARYEFLDALPPAK